MGENFITNYFISYHEHNPFEKRKHGYHSSEFIDRGNTLKMYSPKNLWQRQFTPYQMTKNLRNFIPYFMHVLNLE